METFKDIITKKTCESTIAGWVWFCDSCVTHGNANSSDEAEYLAKSHAKYYSWIEDEDDNEDSETISFMDMDVLEREEEHHNWSYECLGAIYLIDVTNNITYEYGDDYTDKTPNNPFDVDKAVQLQKRLGVS